MRCVALVCLVWGCVGQFHIALRCLAEWRLTYWLLVVCGGFRWFYVVLVCIRFTLGAFACV